MSDAAAQPADADTRGLLAATEAQREQYRAQVLGEWPRPTEAQIAAVHLRDMVRAQLQLVRGEALERHVPAEDVEADLLVTTWRGYLRDAERVHAALWGRS